MRSDILNYNQPILNLDDFEIIDTYYEDDYEYRRPGYNPYGRPGYGRPGYGRPGFGRPGQQPWFFYPPFYGRPPFFGRPFFNPYFPFAQFSLGPLGYFTGALIEDLVF